MAVISAVAVVVSLTVGATTLWPQVGWETPNQHAADYAGIVSDISNFRDEWKCDEYEEELLELLKRQATGDTSIETARKVERLKNKIDELNCQRFED